VRSYVVCHKDIALIIFSYILLDVSLPFSELSLVGLALDLIDYTIIIVVVLQCYDAVSWVI